jgi:hypothetical protein
MYIPHGESGATGAARFIQALAKANVTFVVGLAGAYLRSHGTNLQREGLVVARAGRLPCGCLSLRFGPCSVACSRLRGGSITSRLWRSDFNLFRNQKGIVDVDPKIPNSALDLRVAEQKLDSSEIACPSIDH